MKRLSQSILLSLFVIMTGFNSNSLLTSSLYAQEFEDDFEEEEDEPDEPEEKTPEKKPPEANEESATEKKEERAAATAKDREKKDRQNRDARAEQRVRDSKKRESARRRAGSNVRLKERKARLAYKSLFEKVMAKNKINSKLPAITGFAWGVNLGIQPNVGSTINEGFTFSDKMKFVDDNNNSLFQVSFSSVAQGSSKGVANVANIFQATANEINASLPATAPDSQKSQINSASGSISSLPVGANVAYYSRLFILRAGFNYSTSVIGFGGTNSLTFSVAKPGSTTEVQSITISHKAKVQRIEVPLSFALRFLASRSYGAYLGGGVNYFWGKNTSTISADGTLTTATGANAKLLTETDTFSATTIGFHFLIGFEAAIYHNLFITVELFQTFGFSNRVTDSSIDSATESTSGLAEDVRPDELQLNFTGTSLLFGLRHFL